MLQRQRMMDEDPPLSIEEKGAYINVHKFVVPKYDCEQEEAQSPHQPPEDETALMDAQGDLKYEKKQKRKKRRKRRQKKSSKTFTGTKYIDFGFWKSFIAILCLSCLLVTCTAAFSVERPPVEEQPIIRVQRSEMNYYSVSKDQCMVVIHVGEPPIILMLKDLMIRFQLNNSVHCPDKETHVHGNFIIKTCFEGSLLKVYFKKGQTAILAIEHGIGNGQVSSINMSNDACNSSVEDQTTTKLQDPENYGSKKENRSSVEDIIKAKQQDMNAPTDRKMTDFIRKIVGLGALSLLIVPVIALVFVVKESRDRNKLFSSLFYSPEPQPRAETAVVNPRRLTLESANHPE